MFDYIYVGACDEILNAREKEKERQGESERTACGLRIVIVFENVKVCSKYIHANV